MDITVTWTKSDIHNEKHEYTKFIPKVTVFPGIALMMEMSCPCFAFSFQVYSFFARVCVSFIVIQLGLFFLEQ